MEYVYKWGLGLLSAAFVGTFGWVWRTDRKVIRLESRVDEVEKDVAEHKSPCPDVVELRKAVATQSENVAKLIEGTGRDRESIAEIWPKIDAIQAGQAETNSAIARLEGKLGE